MILLQHKDRPNTEPGPQIKQFLDASPYTHDLLEKALRIQRCGLSASLSNSIPMKNYVFHLVDSDL